LHTYLFAFLLQRTKVDLIERIGHVHNTAAAKSTKHATDLIRLLAAVAGMLNRKCDALEQHVRDQEATIAQQEEAAYELNSNYDVLEQRLRTQDATMTRQHFQINKVSHAFVF
jgi:hypothetical protein